MTSKLVTLIQAIKAGFFLFMGYILFSGIVYSAQNQNPWTPPSERLKAHVIMALGVILALVMAWLQLQKARQKVPTINGAPKKLTT